jgi:hypothetical protein
MESVAPEEADRLKKTAVENLTTALDLGFGNLQAINRELAFRHLREYPPFQALLQREKKKGR